MPTTISVVTDAEWAALQATVVGLQASIAALENAIQNPLIVDARAYPGGDAGQKISAAIAALPVGIGGLVNAWFPNPQNMTGFTIPPGVTVQLGVGLYTLPAASPSITINQGGRLYGMGTNSPGATTIKAFAGFNKDLIQCVSTQGPTDFWHHGRIKDLRLDGNKTNNTSGNGISVFSLAETSKIELCNIANCAQAGLYLKGSQSGTGSIANITSNSNGLYGVQLEGFCSGITLHSVGGDNNPVTFGITNPRLGGGSILLIDPKSEAAAGSPIPDPMVVISGGNSRVMLTLQGGNAVTTETGKTVVRLTADNSVNHAISIVGLTTGGQTLLIDDLRLGLQVPAPQVGYHQFFSYCNGHYVRMDESGFTTVP